jgi:hypothetical protein
VVIANTILMIAGTLEIVPPWVMTFFIRGLTNPRCASPISASPRKHDVN